MNASRRVSGQALGGNRQGPRIETSAELPIGRVAAVAVTR